MCLILYYICSECHHGWSRAMLHCNAMHTPSLKCPVGTRFQFFMVVPEDCFLHPYHGPPTWQGYCQYDQYEEGVLVNRWQDRWPIFQIFDNLFESGRETGISQERSQMLTGDSGRFAEVDFTSTFQPGPYYVPPPDLYEVQKILPSRPSNSTLNPMAVEFHSYRSDSIRGYTAEEKGKAKEVANSSTSSPRFSEMEYGDSIGIEVVEDIFKRANSTEIIPRKMTRTHSGNGCLATTNEGFTKNGTEHQILDETNEESNYAIITEDDDEYHNDTQLARTSIRVPSRILSAEVNATIGSNAGLMPPSSVYYTPPPGSSSVGDTTESYQKLDGIIHQIWDEAHDTYKSEGTQTKTSMRLKDTIDQLYTSRLRKNMEIWSKAAGMTVPATTTIAGGDTTTKAEIKPRDSSSSVKSREEVVYHTKEDIKGEKKSSKAKVAGKKSSEAATPSLNPYGIARELERARQKEQRKARKQAKKQAAKRVDKQAVPVDDYTTDPKHEDVTEVTDEATPKQSLEYKAAGQHKTPSDNVVDDASASSSNVGNTTTDDADIPASSTASISTQEEAAKPQPRLWSQLLSGFGLLRGITSPEKPAETAADSAHQKDGSAEEKETRTSNEEWPILAAGAKKQNKRRNKKRSQKP